jgi:hypothetical protein
MLKIGMVVVTLVLAMGVIMVLVTAVGISVVGDGKVGLSELIVCGGRTLLMVAMNHYHREIHFQF